MTYELKKIDDMGHSRRIVLFMKGSAMMPCAASRAAGGSGRTGCWPG
jgi:glutaredoxin-related protein